MRKNLSYITQKNMVALMYNLLLYIYVWTYFLVQCFLFILTSFYIVDALKGHQIYEHYVFVLMSQLQIIKD